MLSNIQQYLREKIKKKIHTFKIGFMGRPQGWALGPIKITIRAWCKWCIIKTYNIVQLKTTFTAIFKEKSDI